MNTRQTIYIAFLYIMLFYMSTFQICTLSLYLNYTYICLIPFFINSFFILMSGFEIITFDEEIDNDTDNNTNANIQKTIQLYSIGQIILITLINIGMIILGEKIINIIINIGTYYIILYIIYRITNHIIINPKSKHIKRKTI